MKSIKFFAVAACMAISSSVYAQYEEYEEPTGSVLQSLHTSTSTTEGWSTMWLEYNPINFDFNQGIDDQSVTGFSFGYSQAIPITSGVPLFFETGFGVQYSYTEDFWDLKDWDFSMFSCKVPINFIYDIEIPNSPVHIDPFVGLSLRYNITAKINDNKDDDWDLFDKDDMGGSKNTMNRFQAGWQIGLRARFGENFMLGASYGSDFSKIWENDILGAKVKTGVSTTTITLGFCF